MKDIVSFHDPFLPIFLIPVFHLMDVMLLCNCVTVQLHMQINYLFMICIQKKDLLSTKAI